MMEVDVVSISGGKIPIEKLSLRPIVRTAICHGTLGFIDAEKIQSEEEIQKVKKRLIHRHIAWLYALRGQLLVSTPWEHINQGFFYRVAAKRYQMKFGIGLVADEVTQIELKSH